MIQEKNIPKTKSASKRVLKRYFDIESRRLQRAIAREEELIRATGVTRGETIDEAMEAAELAKSMALIEQMKSQLDQVQAARARLAQGTYGICESCHQPIPQARLRALPYTTLCIQCQSHRARARRSTLMFA